MDSENKNINKIFYLKLHTLEKSSNLFDFFDLRSDVDLLELSSVLNMTPKVITEANRFMKLSSGLMIKPEGYFNPIRADKVLILIRTAKDSNTFLINQEDMRLTIDSDFIKMYFNKDEDKYEKTHLIMELAGTEEQWNELVGLLKNCFEEDFHYKPLVQILDKHPVKYMQS